MIREIGEKSENFAKFSGRLKFGFAHFQPEFQPDIFLVYDKSMLK